MPFIVKPKLPLLTVYVRAVTLTAALPSGV
jgi:hypothetical protein